MVEVEKRLQAWAGRLPALVNECVECPLGTTEQLCLYFAQMPLEAHIKIISVSVSETSNRVTQLCLR